MLHDTDEDHTIPCLSNNCLGSDLHDIPQVCLGSDMDDCYSSTLNSAETTEKEESNLTAHLPGKYFEPLEYKGKN